MTDRMIFKLGHVGGHDAKLVVSKLLALVCRNKFTPKMVIWSEEIPLFRPGAEPLKKHVAFCYATLEKK